MSNPSKAKGTSLETALVNWLHSRGHLARRVALAGNMDQGDVRVENWPIVLECKNVKAITLSTFVDEANREAANAALPYGVAIVKRRGTTDVGRYYAVMDVDTLERMLTGGAAA